MAAARKVSHAASNAVWPRDWIRRASFAEVVVFPVPLTPTMETTVGPLAALFNEGARRVAVLEGATARIRPVELRLAAAIPAKLGHDNRYAYNFPVKQTNVTTAANSFAPAGKMANGFGPRANGQAIVVENRSGAGGSVALFNPLCWQRRDPVTLDAAAGPCEAMPDGRVLCAPALAPTSIWA